jgi:type IV pilus assembly protein PilA
MIKNNQTGFTLIELMIVIAILGILASIAIPAYRDYAIRAKISEAMRVTSPHITAYGAYFWETSSLPTNRSATGASNTITEYVEGVTVTDAGLISVDVNEVSTGVADIFPGEDMYIIMTPEQVPGALQWNCSTNNQEDGSGDDLLFTRLVPSDCR